MGGTQFLNLQIKLTNSFDGGFQLRSQRCDHQTEELMMARSVVSGTLSLMAVESLLERVGSD